MPIESNKPRKFLDEPSNAVHESGSRLPTDVLHSWSGQTSRFSPMVEGGPGKISTLLTLGVIAGVIFWQGVRLTERDGIDSVGPLLIFLSISVGVFLILWILIKAVLRDPAVVYYVSQRGVGIVPSAFQKKLDVSLGWIMRIVFWLTLNGGQWSSWHSFTNWKQVRRVEAIDTKQEIIVIGGPWRIRLICQLENYDSLREVIHEQLKSSCHRCIFVRWEAITAGSRQTDRPRKTHAMSVL